MGTDGDVMMAGPMESLTEMDAAISSTERSGEPTERGRNHVAGDIVFLQHRGCLAPGENKAAHNTIQGALDVIEAYGKTREEESWFAGLEMDVSYHAGTWYAAHDPLGADNSADHLPDTFKAYLFVVAPRLREIQRTLNVEIKGVVTAGALAELLPPAGGSSGFEK